MGILLALEMAADVAKTSLETVASAARGRLDRARVDAMCRAFGERAVARARIALELVGAERVPAGRAYVYMSNHQSHMDVPVLYATLPSPTVRMVGKKELFDIPVWGHAMRAAEMICIDRSDRARAIESLRAAGDRIRSGVSVWIAPEGTRSLSGRPGPLKRGGFHLALDSGTPIVPVAISGTRRVLPSGGKSLTPGLPVRVVYGAPIEVAGKTADALSAEVAAFFDAHVDLALSGVHG